METQGGHRTKHTFSPGVGGASSLVSNRISPRMSTFSALHLDSRVSAGVRCADSNEVALAAKLKFFMVNMYIKGRKHGLFEKPLFTYCRHFLDATTQV